MTYEEPQILKVSIVDGHWKNLQRGYKIINYS